MGNPIITQTNEYSQPKDHMLHVQQIEYDTPKNIMNQTSLVLTEIVHLPPRLV